MAIAQVSSVKQTPDVGAEPAKGEEFGFFQFGGSDILLLFQPDWVCLTAKVDKHGLDPWDQRAGSRCFVHITSSLSYFAITGSPPPHQPPTARQYTSAGLPWFEYYAADKQALEGAAKLAGLDSVAAMKIKTGGRHPRRKRARHAAPCRPARERAAGAGGGVLSGNASEHEERTRPAVQRRVSLARPFSRAGRGSRSA